MQFSLSILLAVVLNGQVLYTETQAEVMPSQSACTLEAVLFNADLTMRDAGYTAVCVPVFVTDAIQH